MSESDLSFFLRTSRATPQQRRDGLGTARCDACHRYALTENMSVRESPFVSGGWLVHTDVRECDPR